MIEGQTLGAVPVIPEHDASAIEHDIRILQDLAQHLRRKRFENGALSTGSLKLSFKLDSNSMPVDCWQYERNDARELVEEVGLFYLPTALLLITTSL